jgi:hypothetical protein
MRSVVWRPRQPRFPHRTGEKKSTARWLAGTPNQRATWTIWTLLIGRDPNQKASWAKWTTFTTKYFTFV